MWTGAGRLGECVNDDMKVMKLLSLQPEWAVFRDMGRGFILRQTSNEGNLITLDLRVETFTK